jgi:hypothetical protein
MVHAYRWRNDGPLVEPPDKQLPLDPVIRAVVHAGWSEAPLSSVQLFGEQLMAGRDGSQYARPERSDA